MFFRFKFLALVVLVSSAILSVQAHNGEHEHGDGVVMSVTDGSGKTIFDGENETRAKKETPDRPSSKREPRAADSELEGQAEDSAESETRSYKRDNGQSTTARIVTRGRSADPDSEDAAHEVAASESRSRKKDLKLEVPNSPEPKRDSTTRSADIEPEDKADEGVEGESRSRKRDARRNLRVPLV